ncbi:hypothetical protein ACVMIH_001758 [Bradyrhizobium sp. USDA 4503]
MTSPTIYFAQARRDGPIKIGFTAGKPSQRIAKLQTGCPWPIVILATVSGTTAEEAKLHQIFADLRTEGEWFKADGALLRAIRELAAGIYKWPEQQGEKRLLPDQPSIADVIWAAGGPAKIAAASKGAITVDAVHKWRRNGIRDWHWALLMSLCGATVEQLYRANLKQAASDMPAEQAA